MSAAPEIRLVVITGLSGSGKSTVAKCFEDLRYYCVDNLPLTLLKEFLKDPSAHVPAHDALAVVTDVRAPGFAGEFPEVWEGLDRGRLRTTLLFLEASDETLLRRFSETRRPHPLAGDRHLTEGIREERALLAEIRGYADMVFDSTEWSIHEMRDRVYREFSRVPGETPGTVVSLVSFGYKHGIPKGADLLFDVRFLPNPHFEPTLRPLSGKDAEVREFLEKEQDFAALLDRVEELLLFLRPRYERENRSYLTVAVGCTGGRHRSVAAAEELMSRLGRKGWPLRLTHRDVDR